MTIQHPKQIINFWFEEITLEQMFKKDPEFDKLIADRFGDTITAVSNCECYLWRLGDGDVAPAWGRLAEIIVLDQFRRNVFRDTPEAFSKDEMALSLAQEMIARGDDLVIPGMKRNNVYLPFMHSESKAIQQESLKIYTRYMNDEPKAPFSYAKAHADIVERFDRFPHRNAILGRDSTAEEVEFLSQPGSSF